MPRVSVDITDVLRGLGNLDGQCERAIRATVSDARSRAPGWVSRAVRKEYTIEPAEIKKSLHVSRGGQLSIAGRLVDGIILTYKGRLLTPIHFKMSPKTRPSRRRYRITVEIKRGHRTRLMGKPEYERPAFLASANNSPAIPWQREGKQRLPIQPVKTLSVPQMIATKNGPRPSVEKAVKDALSLRAMHHFERYVLK